MFRCTATCCSCRPRQSNGRIDCGTQGIPLPAGYTPPPPPPAPPASADGQPARVRRPPPPPSPDRFRGVRIFDISDLSNPKQVAAVQSCRGSHTHTLVIDPKDKDNVYIYISGTGNVRQEEELAGCSGGRSGRESEYRVVPHRHHQGAAGASGAGEDRLQPAHLYGCANRSDERPMEGRQPRRRHADHFGHRQVPRHHGLFGHGSGGGRLFRQRNSAGHLQPGQSRPHRRGQRSELRLLAFRQFQQCRHQGAVHGRMGRRRTTALPRDRSDELGRRRYFQLCPRGS